MIALLFDIDGTLIDSGGAGGRALLHALQDQFGIVDPRAVPLHGRTDCGIFRELLESHGIRATPAALQRLCEHYFDLLPQYLTTLAGRVLPGVMALLDTLVENQQCAMGVLTGNMQRSAQTKLMHFQLGHYFDFGIYGDAAPTRPELCQSALECVRVHCQRELPSEQIVVIGDTQLDVELAQAMGARCLAVCTGGVSAQQLNAAGAQLVLDDLTHTERILPWLFGY
ncbi:MAG: HAD family hydrolase [Pirellulaceae bacterium]